MRTMTALHSCYALYLRLVGATWVAFVASVLCLSIDTYAIFTLPHRSVRGAPSTSLFNVALWALEAVIALLALWLLRFAFSRIPRPLPDT